MQASGCDLGNAQTSWGRSLNHEPLLGTIKMGFRLIVGTLKETIFETFRELYCILVSG